MSYLNNILASIGGDSKPASAPRPVSRVPPPIAKRKAEEQLTSGPAKRPVTPNSGQHGAPPKPVPAVPAPSTGYTGSARPMGVTPVPRPIARPRAAQLPIPISTKPSVKSSNVSTAPTTPMTDKPAPKKGSYADILARAKTAQQTKAPIGEIVHKSVDKIKKERSAEAAKGKNIPMRDKKLSDRSRTGSAEVSSKVVTQQAKEKRKPAESTYQGSIKQAPVPTYKGTAGLGRAGQSAKPRRDNNGYANWSDEDAEDEEEVGYDEESDLSDMEAGAFDIDHEEELALRAAKKDDAKELALENELKREKAARLKRLEQLSADRSKKKPGY